MIRASSNLLARMAEPAGIVGFGVLLALAALAFAASDGVLAVAGLAEHAEIARSFLWIAALAFVLLGVASRRGADRADTSVGVTQNS
ncbi:hypothetical protein ACE7GA_06720 [Roseomonas sp. CCTCC AB2023176]|uniref:hypothetical protein n=1 Tax=Roseomonas sp. CCTCC AB2023176 TaxID=3342640 RepID=UPI0035DB2B91